MCLELDTGSYVSTLRLADAYAAGATVLPTRERALAYDGNTIELLGECTIFVSFASRTTKHRFLVVNSCNQTYLAETYALILG